MSTKVTKIYTFKFRNGEKHSIKAERFHIAIDELCKKLNISDQFWCLQQIVSYKSKEDKRNGIS